ncbi:uncharacterized protein MELLADRAFT_91952 [Melampsora larici-populina 98AG31]|uniref:Uncharacterized protein n=1 Tax=Melampsora larici-populina (strain 98AG31 / pathotype 3-4-7) TaxID=747676 RepID=F4S103_MELLP|nr:uncharacterized protein MELLADRAFT_91952 [Melampsora larici-populina 98AG31]EGG01683.1 hypothetical protein MELLADRAFT_91952 [Melampsora larici-populina 98AG31]
MPINTRSRRSTPPGAINLRGAKRQTQTSNQTQVNDQSSNQHDSRSAEELKLDEIDVHTYGLQKKFWPLQRIDKQLKAQTTDNRSQPNPLILAEAQALHEAFQHSLHMLAMIGKVHLDTLKSHLGISGAMPPRGDPNASAILSARNKANRVTYNRLKDDEHAVFTSRIFHALGGYPDYSAIVVEDVETVGDCEVLIPEVPKLSPEEDALYRPLYEKLVDPAKVAKDRKRFEVPSAEKKEKLSLRTFKKRLQQLHHDAILADFDYYTIGCSKTLGTGWCHEFTSLPEISAWMDEKIKFQTIFPIYSQARPEINEIDATAAASNNTKNKVTRPPNKSDRESTELTSLLLTQIKALGVTLPTRGFPRGPDVPAVFEKHKFMLGFDGMKTAGRRNWLQDIKNQKFLMVMKGTPVISPWKVFENDDDDSNGGGGGPGGEGGEGGGPGGDGNEGVGPGGEGGEGGGPGGEGGEGVGPGGEGGEGGEGGGPSGDGGDGVGDGGDGGDGGGTGGDGGEGGSGGGEGVGPGSCGVI